MTASISAITFDCGDAGTLASFWSRVLNRPVDADATPEFAPITLASRT